MTCLIDESEVKVQKQLSTRSTESISIKVRSSSFDQMVTSVQSSLSIRMDSKLATSTLEGSWLESRRALYNLVSTSQHQIESIYFTLECLTLCICVDSSFPRFLCCYLGCPYHITEGKPDSREKRRHWDSIANSIVTLIFIPSD